MRNSSWRQNIKRCGSSSRSSKGIKLQQLLGPRRSPATARAVRVIITTRRYHALNYHASLGTDKPSGVTACSIGRDDIVAVALKADAEWRVDQWIIIGATTRFAACLVRTRTCARRAQLTSDAYRTVSTFRARVAAQREVGVAARAAMRAGVLLA